MTSQINELKFSLELKEKAVALKDENVLQVNKELEEINQKMNSQTI